MSIALIRTQIPSSIRIIMQMTIIASLVIVVDQILRAYAYEISKSSCRCLWTDYYQLYRYGTCRGFCHAEPTMKSFIDGIGNGAGYTAMLLTVATIRELFGAGKLFGMVTIPAVKDGGWYVPNGLLLLPPVHSS